MQMKFLSIMEGPFIFVDRIYLLQFCNLSLAHTCMKDWIKQLAYVNIFLLILFTLFIQTVELITASYFGNGTLFFCAFTIVSHLSRSSQFLFNEMAKLCNKFSQLRTRRMKTDERIQIFCFQHSKLMKIKLPE